jgi:hypothetical protein
MVFFGGKNHHILEITKLWIIKEKKKKKPVENQASFDCVCKGEDSSQPLHIGQFILLQVLWWFFLGKLECKISLHLQNSQETTPATIIVLIWLKVKTCHLHYLSLLLTSNSSFLNISKSKSCQFQFLEKLRN